MHSGNAVTRQSELVGPATEGGTDFVMPCQLVESSYGISIVAARSHWEGDLPPVSVPNGSENGGQVTCGRTPFLGPLPQAGQSPHCHQLLIQTC